MKKVVILLCLFLLPGYSSIAAVEDTAPKLVVKELLEKIKAIKEEDGPATREDAARNEKLKDEANSLVDIQGLSRWSLGEYWDQRSKEEKKQFEELFGKIFKNVAYPKSGKFFRDLEVAFDREKTKGEEASISTTITHRKEGEIEIEYKLRPVNGKWLIYDVIMDGVSLGRNLKNKFLQTVRDGSYSDLVRKLEKKLAEKEIPEGLL
ncbi:MAG: ABC transporter substrate-binding protein [Nitrospinae bacterium]|nr:ABC transporter substrate-binding protein [Nitrospinota bacterium]